ncbi:MAG: hypothetical protein BWY90_00728 [Deltaproteobacteria bacterium ADurb.BinA014]|nr:MAG: hypothetical protein BWY90_00728 [Deltaproteobacteria bacterium ADurb.BinA014]
MNSVFTRALVARGDKHFGALDFPDARIICRIRPRDNITGIGAEIWFGEAHCALPIAGKHFGNKHVVIFLRAEAQNKIGRAAG